MVDGGDVEGEGTKIRRRIGEGAGLEPAPREWQRMECTLPRSLAGVQRTHH